VRSIEGTIAGMTVNGTVTMRHGKATGVIVAMIGSGVMTVFGVMIDTIAPMVSGSLSSRVSPFSGSVTPVQD
jgi:hypothetical protein